MISSHMLALVGALTAVGRTYAEDRFVYCSNNPYDGSPSHAAYHSQSFPLPQGIEPDEYGQSTVASAPTQAFANHIVDHCGVSFGDSANSVWNVFRSFSEAEAGLSERRRFVRVELHDRSTDLPWTYVVERTATAKGLSSGSYASGSILPTAAEALFLAETAAPRGIPHENGKTFWVKRWRDYTCAQLESTASHQYAPPSYTCSVNFAYSDERYPEAAAALGSGPTQDAAIQAAEVNRTAGAWGTPFCSQTQKMESGYKAGEPHPGLTGVEWWVCEVDYTVNQ